MFCFTLDRDLGGESLSSTSSSFRRCYQSPWKRGGKLIKSLTGLKTSPLKMILLTQPHLTLRGGVILAYAKEKIRNFCEQLESLLMMATNYFQIVPIYTFTREDKSSIGSYFAKSDIVRYLDFFDLMNMIYLTVVLICIFLISNGIEHSFITT